MASRPRVAAAFLAFMMSLHGAAFAVAQELSVDVADRARLLDCATAALVGLTVSCPAGGEVLESFVYITQTGIQSEFAPLAVTCDGVARKTLSRVSLLEGAFRKGAAQASAYVLLTSGDSVSPAEQVTLFR